MADAAAPKEFETRTARLPVPGSSTTDYKRLFRKDLMYAAAGVLLAIGVLRAPTPSFLTSDTISVPSAPVTQVQPTPSPLPVEAKQPAETKQTEEQKADEAALVKINRKIDERVEVFLKEDDINKKILAWKPVIVKAIKDPRLNIPPAEQPEWVISTLAKIRVENIHANPNIVAQVDDEELPDRKKGKGLTQITQEAADEIAPELGYKVGGYNIFDPETNIILSTGHQRNLAARFGKKFSGWAYHIGREGMNRSIGFFAVLKGKEPIDQVKKDIDNLLVGPKKYIKQFDLSPEKMLATPGVTGAMRGAGFFSEDKKEMYGVDSIAAERVFTILGTKG